MDVVDGPPLYGNLAVGYAFQPRDHVQQRGLSASRRADQNQKFAFLRRKADLVKDSNIAVVLRDVFDCEETHFLIPSQSRP